MQTTITSAFDAGSFIDVAHITVINALGIVRGILNLVEVAVMAFVVYV